MVVGKREFVFGKQHFFLSFEKILKCRNRSFWNISFVSIFLWIVECFGGGFDQLLNEAGPINFLYGFY